MDKRDLLRALTGVSGGAAFSSLSSKWVKPVIESVVLPAHAQATEDLSSVLI